MLKKHVSKTVWISPLPSGPPKKPCLFSAPSFPLGAMAISGALGRQVHCPKELSPAFKKSLKVWKNCKVDLEIQGFVYFC